MVHFVLMSKYNTIKHSPSSEQCQSWEQIPGDTQSVYQQQHRQTESAVQNWIPVFRCSATSQSCLINIADGRKFMNYEGQSLSELEI